MTSLNLSDICNEVICDDYKYKACSFGYTVAMSFALGMRGGTVLISIISCVMSTNLHCFVCESANNELICSQPEDASVKGKAVYCEADGAKTVCSTTSYIRKVANDGKVIPSDYRSVAYSLQVATYILF